MKNKNQTFFSAKWIAYTAVLTALVAVTGFLPAVPTPGGRIYWVDGAVLIAAYLMDPLSAFIAGGIGTLLYDLLKSPSMMLPSLFIHGAQGAVVSALLHVLPPKQEGVRALAASLAGAIVVVGGYFLFRTFTINLPAAVVNIPRNVIQEILGIALAMLLCYATGIKKRLNKARVLPVGGKNLPQGNAPGDEKGKTPKNEDILLYKIRNSLYVNLTNRCNANCTFCLRRTKDQMDGSGSLWLRREHTADEIKKAFATTETNRFDEVVFCGFGEPTLRLKTVLELAEFVHTVYQKPVRLNTNGLANLEYGRDITPLLQGKIDVLSVSLNTPDKNRYYELTRNKFGEESFDGLLQFVRRAKRYVPTVILTTVSTTLTAEEERACKKICDELGVRYRVRPFEK